MALAHPGFHVLVYAFSKIFFLSVEYSSIIILSTTQVVITYIFMKLFQRYFSDYLAIFWCTIIIFIICPIYLPFFNQNLYLGQGSPNLWHNPTLILVKPFAYLSVLLTVPLLNSSKTKLKETLFLSLIVAISTVIKPSFVISFIPVLSFYTLFYYRINLTAWIKVCTIISPTLLILGWQFIEHSKMGSNSEIIFDFFGVWRIYSPNPLISFVISVLFPLLIIIFRYKVLLNNRFLVFNWMCLLFSFLIFGLFAENGTRYEDANFMWGINVFLPLVFAFSLLEFVKWWKEDKKNKYFYITTLILGLHTISGMLYLYRIMCELSYA
ncbi:MAG: hypothetical protein NWR41_04625 [Rickettsiaceae bacterium]|nr:hypothetical protein [Rickettsiaceae bacterium]MDP5083153.1 hypothetical protein [Rickettsiaceae bacterium]